MTTRFLAAALALTTAGSTALAQQPRVVTAADYARAEKTLAPWTAPLVTGTGVRPTWLPDDRFRYRVPTVNGAEFIMVDPAKGTRARAFDQAKLAAGLTTATGTVYEASQLPFQAYEDARDGSIRVRVGERRFDCNAETGRCGAAVDHREAAQMPPAGRGARGPGGGPPEVMSPDGTRAAFIRDFNLWARDVASGQVTRPTGDGVKSFGYATDNAGWKRSDRPILLWSPDSKKIATFQQDERGVGLMHLVNTNTGHPVLQSWAYPLPGDSIITTIQRVIVDVKNGATDNYADEANQAHAKNLVGKLLRAHGTLDDNVPPNNTTLVVDALIKANKDFDLLMLPNQAHGFGTMSPYMMRRRWDYFVTHLMGAQPPKEYEIKPPQAQRPIP